MRFRSDNQVLYGQDFSVHQGIPAGVDFDVTRGPQNGYTLRAHGYGCLRHDPHDCDTRDRCYGNGSLFVYRPTSRQRARFEAELQATPSKSACNTPKGVLI